MENYALWDHGSFLRDTVRVATYADALAKLTNPTSRVLEIGTGTAFFATLLSRNGVGHIDAIEPDSVIYAARGVLEDNGASDSVTLYRGTFGDFAHSEKYDMIFSDLHGALPHFGQHLQVLIAARDLLKPNGAMVPKRDRVFVAPVRDGEIYEPYRVPWQENTLDIDLSYCARAITNMVSVVHANGSTIIGSPLQWCEIDYSTVTDVDHRAEVEWQIESSATLAGFLGWFETDLTDSHRLSNSPFSTPLVYGQQFFPLPHATPIAAGDTLRLDLGAFSRPDDSGYDWTWRTRILRREGRELHRFEQSTADV